MNVGFSIESFSQHFKPIGILDIQSFYWEFCLYCYEDLLWWFSCLLLFWRFLSFKSLIMYLVVGLWVYSTWISWGFWICWSLGKFRICFKAIISSDNPLPLSSSLISMYILIYLICPMNPLGQFHFLLIFFVHTSWWFSTSILSSLILIFFCLFKYVVDPSEFLNLVVVFSTQSLFVSFL